MTPKERLEYLRKKKRLAELKAKQAGSAPDTEPVEEISGLESAGRGAVQGATLGYGDEASGSIEWLMDKLAGDDSPYAVNRKLKEQGFSGGGIENTDAYTAARDEERAKNKAAEAANPVAYGAGEIGGGAVSSLLPGLGGATALKTGLAAAAEGLGRSEATNAKDMALDATLSGLFGAGASKVLNKVGQGAGNISKALSPAAFKARANRRAVKSLEPILSQQELLNKKGMADDLGRELLDEGVVKFGSSVDDMIPRIENLLSSKGRAIGSIRDKVDDRILERGVDAAGVDIGSLGRKADMLEALAGKGHQGERDVAARYAENLGGMTTKPKRTVGDLQENIAKMNQDIPFEKDLGKLTGEQKALRDLRGDYVNLIDKKVGELAPEDAANYQRLKEQFGLFKQAQPILDKASARKSRNNDIALRDLGLANIAANTRSKRGDDSGVARSIVTGLASKLGRERGNSAMAVTADKVANLLESGKSFGKYTAPLRNALAKGDKSFFVTNAILAQDPEFRQMLQEILGSEDKPK